MTPDRLDHHDTRRGGFEAPPAVSPAVSDVLAFHGLTEHPFGAASDPRYVYMSRTHKAAWNNLVQSVTCGLGMSAVVAEPGMGKTTLLFRLLENFRNTALTAFLFETQCSSAGLLWHIARELDLPSDQAWKESAPERIYNYILDAIMSACKRGRHVLIVIDEAHNLHPQVLETVRLLSNIETSRAKLVHIVICGQLLLLTRLSDPNLEHLQQRIWTVSTLTPLDKAETAEYVNHRLHIAGGAGRTLFDEASLGLIASESEGVPRLINRLCFHALTLAFIDRKKQIDRSLVEAATLQYAPLAAAVQVDCLLRRRRRGQ